MLATDQLTGRLAKAQIYFPFATQAQASCVLAKEGAFVVCIACLTNKYMFRPESFEPISVYLRFLRQCLVTGFGLA